MLKLTMFSWLVVGTVLITVGCQAMVGQIGDDRVKPTAPPTPTVVAPTFAAPLTHTALLTYHLLPTITFRHPSDWTFQQSAPGYAVSGIGVEDDPLAFNGLAIGVHDYGELRHSTDYPDYWEAEYMSTEEAKYELLWQKPIHANANNTVGFIHLERIAHYPTHSTGYMLRAILESPSHNLFVTFFKDFGSYPITRTYETIAAEILPNIQQIEYLVQSVALPPLPQIEPKAIPSPNPLPQPPIITDWSMAQISWYQVPYPTGWLVMRGPSFTRVTDGHITIPQAITTSVPNNYIIQFSNQVQYLDFGERITTVEDLAPAVELLVNKRTEESMTYQGDEYELLWQRPLTNKDTLGLLYVWGLPNYWEADEPLLLAAAYYHLSDGAEMVLSTSFDPDSVQLAHQHGFTETIAQQFNYFVYMAENTVYNGPSN